MAFRTFLLVAGSVLLFPFHCLCAEEPPKDQPKPPAPSPASDLVNFGEMAQAAADLRRAGEAFKQFAESLEGISETIAKSLATMSSEFDPFGYKTAFRTVGRQAEMLQQQHNIIQAMQQEEIERLQKENKRLRKQIKRLRKRQRKRQCPPAA